MNGAVSFAILAPVPEEHLISGVDVVLNHSFVAFGSRKWELFREIDNLRDNEPVPVLIYPSDEDGQAKLDYLIKWSGSYVGHVTSDNGAHPNGKNHRPKTTEFYEGDKYGYWAVFWHVSKLRKLSEDEFIPISSLLSYKSGKYWKTGHPPRGPEIVARPSWI